MSFSSIFKVSKIRHRRFSHGSTATNCLFFSSPIRIIKSEKTSTSDFIIRILPIHASNPSCAKKKNNEKKCVI